MSKSIIPLSLEGIWNSELMRFIDDKLRSNWATIGITTEIEARLGMIKEDRFVVGVNVKYFNGMLGYLKEKNYWTDRNGKGIIPMEEDEYAVVFTEDKRVVLQKSGSSYILKEAIIKIKGDRRTYSFGEHPFGLRIATAEEKPLSNMDTDRYKEAAIRYLETATDCSDMRVIEVRHRRRTTFNFNNEYHIDMTIVQQGIHMKTIQNAPPTYEIECEMGIPHGSHYETIGMFMNAILKRLLNQNSAIPPQHHPCHPELTSLWKNRMKGAIVLKHDIELLNSEGYDDELISWCKAHHSEGRAILPRAIANQIPWCLSHPSKYCTLYESEGMQRNLQMSGFFVLNYGGTISIEGREFHCCMWQYEGLLLENVFSSVKREAVHYLVCWMHKTKNLCQWDTKGTWIQTGPKERLAMLPAEPQQL